MFGLTLSEWASIGTVATAAVAVLAALFAGWQVWEIRRTRREQARPFVVVDVQPSAAAGNILNLVVENVGTTVAFDVKLEFTPTLKTTRDSYDIGDSVLIREGVPMLPPRRKIQALFDVSHKRVNTDLPMRYDVVVTLNDSRGRKQDPQRYVIDLGYLYGLARVEELGTHHAAKALHEIEKTVKKWTGSSGRLNVWTRDEDEHRRDERIEHDLTGHYPTLSSPRPPEILMALARRSVVFRLVVRFLRSLQKRP